MNFNRNFTINQRWMEYQNWTLGDFLKKACNLYCNDNSTLKNGFNFVSGVSTINHPCEKIVEKGRFKVEKLSVKRIEKWFKETRNNGERSEYIFQCGTLCANSCEHRGSVGRSAAGSPGSSRSWEWAERRGTFASRRRAGSLKSGLAAPVSRAARSGGAQRSPLLLLLSAPSSDLQLKTFDEPWMNHLWLSAKAK